MAFRHGPRAVRYLQAFGAVIGQRPQRLAPDFDAVSRLHGFLIDATDSHRPLLYRPLIASHVPPFLSRSFAYYVPLCHVPLCFQGLMTDELTTLSH